MTDQNPQPIEMVTDIVTTREDVANMEAAINRWIDEPHNRDLPRNMDVHEAVLVLAREAKDSGAWTRMYDVAERVMPGGAETLVRTPTQAQADRDLIGTLTRRAQRQMNEENA